MLRSMDARKEKVKSAPEFLGLRAWYDASHASYLSLSGAAITQFLDRSGNGNHTGVQGTSTARAQHAASQINGLPAATFDGGDGYDLPSALYSIPNGANTVFAVAKRTSEDASIDGIFSLREAGNARLVLFYLNTAGNISYRSNQGGTVVSQSGNTNTNFQILHGRRSGTTQAVTANGQAETTDTNGLDESGCDGGRIGEGSTGLYLTGSLAELLIYNRSLSVREIAQVERYLSNKYAIPLA